MNFYLNRAGILTLAQSTIFSPKGGGGDFALKFDGSNSVNVPYSSLFFPSALTAELWYKTYEEPENQGIMGIDTNGSDGWIIMGAPPGFYTCAGACSDLVFKENLYDGSWHHVAAVWNGSALRIFVDGTMGGPVNMPVIPSVETPLKIGRYSTNGHPWIIDKVRISNIARYNNTFTPSVNFTVDANTVLLFNFNEGSGTTCADESPNAFVGTLTDGGAGIPIWVPGQ